MADMNAKKMAGVVLRTLRCGLALLGATTLAAVLAQFTQLPWNTYKWLAEFPEPTDRAPTHILLMGAGGIPGESGLMRTFYGAVAAGLHPDAELLVAMPQGAEESEASRAYLDELRLRGVPVERLSILDNGRNTREQALRMAERLGDANASSAVLVVTDPTHVRRTALSLRRAGVAHVAAMPAFQYSLEDSTPWGTSPDRATHSCTEPDIAFQPTPQPAAESVLGRFTLLRYAFWNHLGYTFETSREVVALGVYRLRGWI
jgi:uncharacterized SAM-binding protein YcdF (DUF218 family)